LLLSIFSILFGFYENLRILTARRSWIDEKLSQRENPRKRRHLKGD